MAKYRYSTDAVFMTERPFMYNGKKCRGLSCFFGFKIITHDKGELFFEVEDSLDPYQQEEELPELLQRILNVGFGYGLVDETNKKKVSFEIDSFKYMEKVNHDHKIDSLIIYPSEYYVDTVGTPDEEEKKMMQELGLSLDSMLVPEEISESEFYKILQDKDIFSSDKIFATDSNTAYGWIEVEE